MQMIALYLPVKAKVRAASGISNAPGTRAISISLRAAPDRSSPSQALSSNRSVINALNRATTMANRLPVASSFPSSARNSASGTRSTFNLYSSVISVSSVINSDVNPCDPRESVATKLLSLKRRRPLLQKRRSPFLLILCSAAHAKQHRLQVESLGQSHLHPFVDGLHRILHGQRSIRNNLRHNRLRPRNQIGGRGHFIHQPNAMRLLRRDHLARQHHLHREALAHQPRQPLRSS